MNRIAFCAKSISPLFKSIPQYTKKIPYASISSSYKNYCAFTEYNSYINNKKENLKNKNLPFTERLVKKNSNSYSILIYDSDTNKKCFNNQIRDESERINNLFIIDESLKKNNSFIKVGVIDTTQKNYISENFSLAVAQGIHPRNFSSIGAIKNQSALNTEKIDNYHKKIPKTGYYFDFKNLFDVLTDIITSIDNNFKSYLLKTNASDTCAIIIEKQDNKLKLKFYNPESSTNTYKIFILRHVDDIKHLAISDFMNLLQILYSYFKEYKVILSTETVTTNNEADIKILGDITISKVSRMLASGHYKTELVPKNEYIFDDIERLDDNDRRTEIIYDTYLYCFNKKIQLPILVDERNAFMIACNRNHVESIKDYIDDVLNLPYNVSDRIKFLFFDSPGSIYNSMLYNTSEAWEVFFTATLENKTLSSEDKIYLLISKFASPILNLDLLYDDFMFIDGDDIFTYRLEIFNKYLEGILNTDTFTGEEKIKIIIKTLEGNFFYRLFVLEKLDFFKSYLDIILNNENISYKTKLSLLKVAESKDIKERRLYDISSSVYLIRTITYITKIITSTLRIEDKQYLLDIENDFACAHVLQHLEITNPEIAKKCIDIIPSYRKTKEWEKNKKID
jgi:hypothetical protein